MFRYDVAELFVSESPPPHVEKRSNDGSHHIAKEAVGCYLEAPDAIFDLGPSRFRDVTDRRFGIGINL